MHLALFSMPQPESFLAGLSLIIESIQFSG